MDTDALLSLFQTLVRAHGPPGAEAEVEAAIGRELDALGVRWWADAVPNLYARLPGEGLKVMVCAHKDEIGMVVTEVLANGRLRLAPCGGAFPWKYGEGPVEVLTQNGAPVRGVLSAGSIHTRKGPLHELKASRAWTWDLATVFTGLSPEALKERGVGVGCRAVVARERKTVERLGDYFASYAMDDRIGVTILLAALRALHEDPKRPNHRFDFVITHGEELGMLGAVRAAHKLQPDVCVAIDTSPVTPDLPLSLDGRPVVWFSEATFNNTAECHRLLELADGLGFGAQPAAYTAAASDAGRIKQHGLADRTVCFGPARDNSHGFEIAHVQAPANVATLLVAYLKQLEG